MSAYDATEFHAKLFAHELSKRNSVGNSEKLASALLDAQVDLNPHQVEAALFAFKSPLSKGAILADEVGLGKTIEAGLVLAQKWSESKKRILIITPANLRKQWSQELEDKFYLPTEIFEAKVHKFYKAQGIRRPFERDKIVITSYQFAARSSDEIMLIDWDLVIIDEAHRLRNVYKSDSKTANKIKTCLSTAPKILLTATPLQNSLMELYGLTSIIDEHVFGDVNSFRTQYAKLSEAHFSSLKSRLSPVCHRTLRRQVVEYIKCTNRIPLTQEFVPSKEEEELYNDVSEYLRRPNLKALPNAQRSLMTLILRKLLASSTFAIAGALDTLTKKLSNQLKQDIKNAKKADTEIKEDFEDYDDTSDEWEDEETDNNHPLNEAEKNAISKEIEDLSGFRDKAIAVSENAKGKALLQALETGFAKVKELNAQNKAIIFTESRRTQEYLAKLLSENGFDGKIVLFNGTNSDPNSRNIYNSWANKHRNTDRVTGSKSADMRAALVDYFKNDASIMIATEAAAEGINLQFCSIVVNYDLPWNPQRIEQRIGRCHRYGQLFDVVVINFLNKNNAADQRVYELLKDKFKLFDGVFGASDEVLGAVESGVNFEKRITAIYQECRTSDEIDNAFQVLRNEMDESISVTMEDTRQKLLENFDAEVHDRLKINMKTTQEYLDKYERMLWGLTKFELKHDAVFDENYLTFFLKKRPDGINTQVGNFYLGKRALDGHRYRLMHPLAQHLIENAKSKELLPKHLEFNYSSWGKKSAALEPFIGKSGVLTAQKMSIRGIDDQDYIILAALTDDGASIDDKSAKRLFELPCKSKGGNIKIEDEKLQTAIELTKENIIKETEDRQANWFQQEMDKLDLWAEDKRSGLKADLKEYDRELKELKRTIRTTTSLPEKLSMKRQEREIEKKRAQAWKDYDDAAKNIGVEKDSLLDEVEAKLKQSISHSTLFQIRFSIH